MQHRSLASRFVAVSTLLVLGFGIGLTMHKYKYFPYRHVQGIARLLIGVANPASVSLDSQYSLDPKRPALHRRVDTGLLPLTVHGIRVSEEHRFPKGGGAVTTIGESVVIVDRLGNFYAYRSSAESIEKLRMPALPNDIEKYVARVGALRINERTFRAYDLLYIPSRREIAVSHEMFDSNGGTTRLAVSLLSIDENTLEPTGKWNTIFLGDLEPDGSNEQGGGALALKGSDKLHVALGDYGEVDLVADPASTFGKTFEVDLTSGQRRLFSQGHRNPQGMVTLNNGDIIEVEQGPYGGDELNVLRADSNYGWPKVSLGTDYGTYDIGSRPGDHSGYAQPIFSWVPSIGVSSVIQLQRFDARWKGDLLVTSLKGESLFRLRLADGHVQYSEPIFLGQRIRDVTEAASGTVVAWTDDAQLLVLTVDAARLTSDLRNGPLKGGTVEAECLYCHHFGPTGPSDFAPSLSGLFHRRIASDNFRYSDALRSRDEVWTEESLRAFVSNPAEFAEGTAMPRRPLEDDQLDEVIAALKAASYQ